MCSYFFSFAKNNKHIRKEMLNNTWKISKAKQPIKKTTAHDKAIAIDKPHPKNQLAAPLEKKSS
jgi:hypothetical protein